LALEFWWRGGFGGGPSYAWDNWLQWEDAESNHVAKFYPGSHGRVDDIVYFVDPTPGGVMQSPCNMGPANALVVGSVYEDGTSGFDWSANEFYVWGAAMGLVLGYAGSVRVTGTVEVSSDGGVNHDVAPLPSLLMSGGSHLTHSIVTEGIFNEYSFVGDGLAIGVAANSIASGAFYGDSYVIGSTDFGAGPFIWDSSGIIQDTDGEITFGGVGRTIFQAYKPLEILHSNVPTVSDYEVRLIRTGALFSLQAAWSAPGNDTHAVVLGVAGGGSIVCGGRPRGGRHGGV
jgi:hypothetical protein